MEPGHWPSEHSDALRDYFLKGMSYAEIGRQINARFGTAYTRNAVVGRAKRLGLVVQIRTTSPSIVPALPSGACLVLPHRPTGLTLPPKSAMKPTAQVKLRCVGVQPRLVPLVELAGEDCRYPYGGDKDGERRAGAGSARVAGPVVLRLVSAA
ncbi:MAG: hypothetical protein JF604_27170 [Bradyrhizobium sp.]|nr:hypothetical protein [Bradyrhizobium sp.]